MIRESDMSKYHFNMSVTFYQFKVIYGHKVNSLFPQTHVFRKKVFNPRKCDVTQTSLLADLS